jgi:hypothetical protein
MASVAKWLRQWFVVPPFVGSIPIVRPQLISRKTGSVNAIPLNIIGSEIAAFHSRQLAFILVSQNSTQFSVAY